MPLVQRVPTLPGVAPMTCIVGITDGKTVTIGGDSATANDDYIDVSIVPKVWEQDGWAYGFTSSWRMGQLLRWAFCPPPMTEGPIERYMVVDFVNALRMCLADGGWLKKENEVERGGAFLVGHAGRLFRIDSDFQVAEVAAGVDAVGCGDFFALGALHALGPKVPAKDRALKALEAAAAYSTGVRGPFTVVEVSA